MMPPKIVPTQESLSLLHTAINGSELWLGDYSAATNVGTLRRRAIKSVLTAAPLTQVYPAELQIIHKTIPAFDIPLFKIGPHFAQAFIFIREALSRGNLLLDCSKGNSISAVLVLVYLMRSQGMAFEEALQYLSSKRNNLNINQAFLQKLRAEATTSALMPLFEITQKEISRLSTQVQQKRPKRDLSGEKKCFSLGPVKSLSGKLVISLEKSRSRSRSRDNSLRMAKPQTQVGKRNGKENGEFHDGRLPISKLSRQFLALRNDKPRKLVIQR